ncbi:MAG TPA: DUF2911 domain-containing protein [Sediminibacterium sp.]|nr:DUF2911 domain-containing protein [Sediminibacterium sp.]
MRLLLCLAGMFLFGGVTIAQSKVPDLDKSPMDMSYWPNNYPLLKMNGKAKEMPVARIIYSRPAKNGRVIFGGLLRYNELWRLGANESTEIEFFRPVNIGGKPIQKGRYTLYCIPTEKKWTLILNTDNYAWGSFTYDNKKDVVRITCDVIASGEPVEFFSAFFEEKPTGANLVFEWDTLKVTLPISF